jgi:MYXO-CTERM domain-containing protein
MSTLGFRCRRAVVLAVVTWPALAAWPGLAHASATFTIKNLDGAGQGLNDPTPVAPVGGNSGTTLGQQRMNVFLEVTGIWGKLIDSTVPIVIDANFGSLSCSASSITLGQAVATGFEFNVPGLPPDMLFPEALAVRIAGVDLAPGMSDILATFNGDLAACSGGQEDWYYGFDGLASDAQIDLVSVVLHELGHGLGFFSGVDDTTGELAGATASSRGFIDAFSAHLFDNGTGQLWSAMSNAERAASALNVRHLVWQGDNVAAMAPKVLALGAPRIAVSPAQGGLEGALAEANFGPYLSAGSVHGPVVVGNPVDGCGRLPSYTGAIVLFQGGDCPSVQKASLAESAGALAVLISDPEAVAPPSSVEVPADQKAMFPVSIPAIGVTLDDADLLAGGGETATLDADGTRLVGADAQGRMYLYASNPLIEGSSVSHWDPLARPNLTEEPNASYDVSHDMRMEAALMRDIGWTPFCGNGQIDQAEQCDNGPANSDTTPGACRTDCTTAHCGDGVVDPGEGCDDGPANSDTVAGACHTTCVAPVCGDGIVDPGEACDDGAANGTTPSCDLHCNISAPPSSGGCGCAVGEGSGAPGVWLLVGLGLLLGKRRRAS